MRLANCTCQRVNDYLKEHDSIMLVLGSTETTAAICRWVLTR